MTRAVPKEMLPVVDRPLIQYAVEEAVAAGISELVFVIDRPRPLLEAHFRAVPALAGKIETDPGGNRSMRRARSCPTACASSSCVRRSRSDSATRVVRTRGGGRRAVRGAVAGRPHGPGEHRGADRSLPSAGRGGRRRGGGGPAGRYRPLRDRGGRCGPRPRRPGAVDRREARPAEAPSNLGVVGRYVFDASIMDLLADTAPGAGGEIQLTDAIARLAGRRRGLCLPVLRRALRLRRSAGLAPRDGGARAPRRPAGRRLSPPRRVAARHPPLREGTPPPGASFAGCPAPRACASPMRPDRACPRGRASGPAAPNCAAEAAWGVAARAGRF